MRLFNMVSTIALFGAIFSLGATQTAFANVADDLNTNYNNIVDNCGSSDQPAYECSGNIVRLTSASTKYNVWDPSPVSAQNKAVSFTYLRHDIKVDLGFGDKLSGIIYYPSLLNPDVTESTEVTCAFPMDGWTTGGRPDGCKRPGDNKTCQDLGIHTADDWYKDLMSRSTSGNSRYIYQCGFSMTVKGQNIAQDFNENLKVINKHFGETMLDGNGKPFINPISRYNEIVVKPLPSNASYQIINPEKLPIQAFFYMTKGDSSGLSDAQYYQKQYLDKAHVLVPIVKINNDDPANISFSYNPEDRGVTIADELNTNYNKVVDNCGGKDKPAFQCSGILLRQASYSSSYHVWDPSPRSIQYGGISISYLRKDLQFRRLLQTQTNSGFIYYPSQQAPSGIENANISCSFPTGADTDSRPDGRCGAYTTYPKSSIECQQQDIYTADDWYKKFSDPAIVGYEKFFSQCGFNVSNVEYDIATAFSESLKAHNLAEANTISGRGGVNEVVVKTQATDASGKSINPEQLPLEAFFYQNAVGLIEAQAYQQDYYNTTGKVVPVVYMNTSDFNNISFSYFTSDQAVNKGDGIAQELTSNYNKVIDNCGSTNKPSSDCSGNIIRFTSWSDEHYVWDPSPPAVGRKGVSFMYIRQDLPLDKSFKGKNSGLIYYPTKEKPLSKEVSDIRCAFSVDGYTDRRYTDGQNDACGATKEYPNDSQPCQVQGITTGDVWYAHFSSIPDVSKDRLQHQCGFSLSSNEQNLGSIFKAVLDGQKLLQASRGGASYDELVLAIPSYNTVTDAEGKISYHITNPKVLPIEAFFYTNESGLTEARGYQQDYHDTVGVDAPIVKLDLNTTSGLVTYSYNKADQTDAYNQTN